MIELIVKYVYSFRSGAGIISRTRQSKKYPSSMTFSPSASRTKLLAPSAPTTNCAVCVSAQSVAIQPRKGVLDGMVLAIAIKRASSWGWMNQ